MLILRNCVAVSDIIWHEYKLVTVQFKSMFRNIKKKKKRAAAETLSLIKFI